MKRRKFIKRSSSVITGLGLSSISSSQGQVFIVEAFHTHYNHSYGCGIITVLYYRGTNLLNQTNLFSQTSSLGGNWSFSKPGNSSFRIQKNGGTYNYPGYWWIRITCNGKSY